MELSRSAGEEVVGEASSAFENKYRDNRAVAWDEAKDAAVAEQEEASDGSSSDEEASSEGEGSESSTALEKGRRVPAVLRLFSFATCFDWFLMIVGFVAAALHGFILPASMLILGELVNVFAFRNITGDVVASLVNSSVRNVVPDSELNCTVITALISGSSSSVSTIVNFQCLGDADFTSMVDTLVIGFVGLGVAGFILGFIQVSTFSLAAMRQTHRIRKRFYRSILRQNVAWFDENKAGELNSRLVDDLVKVQDGIGDKFSISVQLVCNFIFGYVVGFVIEWHLALFMLACAPLLVGASFIFTKLLSLFFSKEQVQYAHAGAVAEEVLGSIRTVVAFGGEQKEYNRYKGRLVDARRLGITKGAITGVMNGLIYVIIFTVYAAALTFGAYLVEQQLTGPGEIVTVFFAVMIGAFSLSQAGPSLEELGVAAGAMNFIYETIHRVPPIDSSSDEGTIPNHIEGKVEFRGVTFAYPSRPDTVVMDDFSAEASVGKTLALVGPSGSGKSTTVQLIQRFYDPDVGTVLLDGKDLRDLNLRWLRRNIGVVSQEPVLFGTTIAENIRYGREGVTQEEIEAAAKAANAHDFIMTLPDKYETLAGGSGAQMSGGQKQRIAIARALVRDPKILLLDEATSALDAESEGIVQKALDKARQGRTTIVIAHRLSTIRNADTIAVLSGGHVAEIGNHETLMAQKGLYFDLVTSQTDGQREIFDEKTMFEYKTPDSRPVLKRQSILRPASLVRQLSSLGGLSLQETFEENPETENVPCTREIKEYDATIPKVPLWKVLQLNAKEWPLLLLGAMGSIFEGATFPMFAIIIGEILRVLLQRSPLQDIWMWSVILCVLGISVGIGVFFKTFCFTTSGTILTGRLRRRAFKAMLHQEMGWFDDKFNSTGALTTRLASDAAQVQGATGSRLGTLCQVTVTLFLSLLVVFIYSWSLALVFLGYAPILFVAAGLQLAVIARFSKRNKKDAEEAGKVSVESIDNMRTVAGLNLEVTFYELYCKRVGSIRKRSRFLPSLVGLLYGFSQGILIMGYAIIYRYGAFQVIQRSDSTLFTISFDLLRIFTVMIFGAVSIGQLFAVAPSYTKARLAANRIVAILNRIPAIDSYSAEGEKPEKAQGEVELSEVHFSYPTRPEVEVLKGLNVSVQQGKTLALVGPSGCGKSTVVSLIERFYDPSLEESGKVEIDKRGLHQLNIQWLRSKIGLVSQEPVLFDGSIADNIRYGDLSREISDEEVEVAASAANIHNFIMSQPMGYDTNVGSRGTQMSGGQKQRIAIARALVRDPKILLLDEATSALDARSERTVQTALDAAQEGRTSIVIAHRLSTIRNADQIAVIKAGKVAEVGTHRELLERGGLYHRLNKAQVVAAREHKKTMLRRASTPRQPSRHSHKRQ